MKTNMNKYEQHIRLILAFYVFALMRIKKGGSKTCLCSVGMMFLLTGLSGYCPSYELLDMLAE